MSPNLHEIQRYYWPVTFVTDQHKVLQGNAFGPKSISVTPILMDFMFMILVLYKPCVDKGRLWFQSQRFKVEFVFAVDFWQMIFLIQTCAAFSACISWVDHLQNCRFGSSIQFSKRKSLVKSPDAWTLGQVYLCGHWTFIPAISSSNVSLTCALDGILYWQQ